MGESFSTYGGVHFYRFEDGRKMDIQEITIEVKTSLFQCGICGNKYKSKGTLKRHLGYHADQDKKFICNQCGKEFKHRYLLLRHEKVHASIKKKHICEVCGKSYSSTGALSDHRKFKHFNEGFLCNKCDKRFKNAYHLRRHIATHKDEKDGCKKFGGFFRQLKKHEKTCCNTSREAVESCELCGKKFLEKRYLQEHIKNKHNSTGIPCGKCEKTFRNRKSLLKHRKMCTSGAELM
ncbi:zinc finger protein 510-like [Saccostrea cucullata]|uniref:zinc finger protein 510-like n=1 Tax=Saccostrea cuccullata TaxID=36930 RepID=UPI002ED34970